MNAKTDSIYHLATTLLGEIGLDEKINSIEPIYKGGNNQLFCVKLRSKNFLLKKYFQHPGDKRNRLDSEYSFLEMAHERTPNFVPKPFAKINAHGIALYEFVFGCKINSTEDIKKFHVSKAAQFINSLNTNHVGKDFNLPDASEACFSIYEHLDLINGRIEELIHVSPASKSFDEIMNQVQTKWNLVKELVIHECSVNGIDPIEKLPIDKRIISPSDFGFHNCIVKENQEIIFVDFEYAGWDDPAKLVCDFFNQVAIPVDNKYIDIFINEFQSEKSNFKMHSNRIKVLLDAYKLKWCCIVLNIYIKKNLDRRIFASHGLDIKELEASQISKAKKILESMHL